MKYFNLLAGTFKRNVFSSKITTNTQYTVKRMADVIMIKKLFIPIDKNLQNIISLEIALRGSIVCDIPFDILLSASKVSYTTETIIINIPRQIFTNDMINEKIKSDDRYRRSRNHTFDGFITSALTFDAIKIMLKSSDTFEHRVGLRYLYCSNETRQSFFENSHLKSLISYKKIKFIEKDPIFLIDTQCDNILVDTQNTTLNTLSINYNDAIVLDLNREHLQKMELKYYWCNGKNFIEYIHFQNALYETLCEYLPEEIICCIEKYFLGDIQYYYNISCDWIDNDIYNDKNVEDHQLQLCFDNTIDGNLTFVNNNFLGMSSGMGGMRCDFDHAING